MKILFTSNNVSEVELLGNLLEKEGIENRVQTTAGAIPFTECYPALWIEKDEDYAEAKSILESWRTALGS